jgi:hypothetical protein
VPWLTPPTVSRTNAAEQDLPGRWVGGALGVLATALVGGTLVVVDAPSGEVHLGFPAVICLLGLPIAFIVGRHFAATLQKPGMESTIWAAMSFGLVAPILGDLEIVGGSLLFPWIWPQHGAEPLLLATLALGFGAVASYAAAPITLAVRGRLGRPHAPDPTGPHRPAEDAGPDRSPRSPPPGCRPGDLARGCPSGLGDR